MISNLNFSLFSSKELFTFGKNAVTLAEAKKSSIPALQPFLTNAKTRLTTFQSALERESKNPVIQLQSEKDKIRIDAFMAFRNFTESGTTRRKEGVPAAAGEIIGVIRKHSWSVQMLGQKNRTAAINNIVSEIKTKHAAQLALTGGTELLDELEQAQLDYEETAKLVVETASGNSEPTVSESRPELVLAIKSLFQIINLQQISAPSADLTALIAALNEHITTSIATVKATDTRAENAKKKTGDKTTL